MIYGHNEDRQHAMEERDRHDAEREATARNGRFSEVQLDPQTISGRISIILLEAERGGGLKYLAARVERLEWSLAHLRKFHTRPDGCG